MARWLLDCRPHCGYPWRLGVATTDAEKEAAFRLRHDVFFRECGYRNGGGPDGRDVDRFDEWCDQLLLWDEESNRVISTCRAMYGAEAMRRGGLYAADEFDYTPLLPIADQILQGGRTCVAADSRTGPAVQYLSYGMELLLRESGCRYFLGAESIPPEGVEAVSVIHSYLVRFGSDPEIRIAPQPNCRVEGLREVPVTEADERRLPGVIRADLKAGFRACGAPAWDADFGCYDVPMLARRDRMSRTYERFLERVERAIPAETEA